jgi:2-polyprenyl-3-methyl-5-hydroxy-6-metoxy-1,4-benzoquinol methylase
VSYRQRLYESYISSHVAHVRSFSPELLESERPVWSYLYKRFLPKDLDARILDLGCGYGAFLNFLQKDGFKNSEGVDVSPEQIAKAQELGLDNVTCDDAMNFLRQRPAQYDCVVAIDVIEHFPKEEAFALLEAVNNCLRPGGTVLIQCPNGDSPFAGRHLYGDFTHEFALTSRSAKQIFEATGFDEVGVYPVDPVVLGISSALRNAAWKLISRALSLYLAVETGVMGGHILTQNLIATAKKPYPHDQPEIGEQPLPASERLRAL